MAVYLPRSLQCKKVKETAIGHRVASLHETILLISICLTFKKFPIDSASLRKNDEIGDICTACSIQDLCNHKAHDNTPDSLKSG